MLTVRLTRCMPLGAVLDWHRRSPCHAWGALQQCLHVCTSLPVADTHPRPPPVLPASLPICSGYYADIPFVSESVYHQVQLSEYA